MLMKYTVIVAEIIIVVLMCIIQAQCLYVNPQPNKFLEKRYKGSQQNEIPRARSSMHLGHILDFVELVNKHGYPGEEHQLTTSDGYILHTHRIPGSPNSPENKNKPVVYLQHGLLASSDTWVLMGPDHDLAFMLADAGFDVWMGNVRGNCYSRSHISMSPDYNSEFWQYSFHEIALYDVTANIDYILQETGQKNLIYIGHSMGTTISYVLLSMKPEYNKKISLLISLAPVAMWHAPLRPFIRFLQFNTVPIKNFVTNARIQEVFPLTPANALFSRATCSDRSALQPLCLNALYFMSGYNPSQVNSTIIPYLFSYTPAGTSTKNLIHYSQNIETGNFQMFDYGILSNLDKYKKTKPPLYDLKKIKVPVAILYGNEDAIVSPKNAVELSKKLPNVVTFEAVPDERFTHLDFLFARDVKTLLNDRLMEIVTQFTNDKVISR